MNLKNLLLSFLVSFLIFFSYEAESGDFVVDGCFECGNESYQVSHDVIFNFDDGSSSLGGLHFGEDNTGQYLFFMMSEDYVDTTYGTNSTDYSPNNTNKFKTHSFHDLLSSDNLGNEESLQFFVNGNTTTVQVDLLACEDSCDKHATTYSSSNTFISSGTESAGYGLGDGSSTGDVTFIEEIKTSMDYNVGLAGFNTADSLLPVGNEGWQTYVGYEFKFSPNTFADWINPSHIVSDFLALGESHASPPKRELKGTCIKGDPACPNTTQVPEPNSLSLLLLVGVIFLTSRYRRL